jgi:hypothetical protein
MPLLFRVEREARKAEMEIAKVIIFLRCFTKIN